MKLKQQEYELDCGLACLSMILDKPYSEMNIPEDMLNAVIQRGIYYHEIKSILELNGLEEGRDFRRCNVYSLDSKLVETPTLGTNSNVIRSIFEQKRRSSLYCVFRG